MERLLATRQLDAQVVRDLVQELYREGRLARLQDPRPLWDAYQDGQRGIVEAMQALDPSTLKGLASGDANTVGRYVTTQMLDLALVMLRAKAHLCIALSQRRVGPLPVVESGLPVLLDRLAEQANQLLAGSDGDLIRLVHDTERQVPEWPDRC
jgi:hypothetical protein